MQKEVGKLALAKVDVGLSEKRGDKDLLLFVLWADV